MNIFLLTLILFGSLLVCLALGTPVAFALGGLAMIATVFLWGPASLYIAAITTFGQATSYYLLAGLGFIFMATLLKQSGIAEGLFDMMHKWLGPVRGGLAIASILTCTVFAAMSGGSGPGVIAVGLVAIPAMLKRNYHKDLALGSVSAGGVLGIVIPPSIPMIIYGYIAKVSVGKLFMAGVFPGLLCAALHSIYILVRCYIQKGMGPALAERVGWREKVTSSRSVVLPMIIIIAVLGGIYLGVSTPTEASGIGAFATLLAVIISRRFTWQGLWESLHETLKLLGMIMWIVIGAMCFINLYNAVGAQTFIRGILYMFQLGPWGTLMLMMASIFVLGMMMDDFAIILLAAPLYAPIIVELGFDPLWFALVFILNIQMAFLTPPYGFNLFYLRAIVPKGVTMGEIYHSIVPFVGVQMITLILVIIFPRIALWLPSLMIK